MPKPDHRPLVTNEWREDPRTGRQRITSKRIDCTCHETCEQVERWRRDDARAPLARELKLLFARFGAA